MFFVEGAKESELNLPNSWEIYAVLETSGLEKPTVLPMGFSPRQVHYEFSVSKEVTVERSWGERVITNFIPRWQVSH